MSCAYDGKHVTATLGAWMTSAGVAQQLDYDSGAPYLLLTPDPAVRRGRAASSYYVNRARCTSHASYAMQLHVTLNKHPTRLIRPGRSLLESAKYCGGLG